METLTTQLSEIEKAEFESLEDVISRGMGSFIAVGKALLTIQDSKLYREQFQSFEEYCKNRWGIGQRYAFRLISGSRVATNLLVAPGPQLCHPCEMQPIHEKQVRPLTILEPGQQCEIWEEAVKTAPAGLWPCSTLK